MKSNYYHIPVALAQASSFGTIIYWIKKTWFKLLLQYVQNEYQTWQNPSPTVTLLFHLLIVWSKNKLVNIYKY